MKCAKAAFYSKKLLSGRDPGKVSGVTSGFLVGLKVKVMQQRPLLTFINYKYMLRSRGQKKKKAIIFFHDAVILQMLTLSKHV